MVAPVGLVAEARNRVTGVPGCCCHRPCQPSSGERRATDGLGGQVEVQSDRPSRRSRGRSAEAPGAVVARHTPRPWPAARLSRRPTRGIAVASCSPRPPAQWTGYPWTLSRSATRMDASLPGPLMRLDQMARYLLVVTREQETRLSRAIREERRVVRDAVLEGPRADWWQRALCAPASVAKSASTEATIAREIIRS